jgi:methyl-accepting chemotaxis protein
VKKILAFASGIASGDFTQRIKLAQNDEFGKLGKALNDATDNLEKLTTETIMASRNLMQAIDEITDGNQDLSQRTSEQASSLEEIASTVEEAAATIKNNADNAQEANLLSGDAIRIAEEGGRIVVEAVTAINEMSASSKRIGEIISVINEIAFQTNLLALNAAVEAARAGEQGRGFAVVAGEVRNLAQRAGSAAKEIGGLIKDSIEKVENSTKLANKSGAALKDVIESINKVGKLISEIAAASEEHKQGIDQINSSVVELDTLTQQNSALVEETASSSEEMANQAQELVHMLERFKAGEEYKEDPSEMKYRYEHKKALAQEKNKKIVVKQNRSAAPKTLKKENARDGKDDVGTLLAEEGFEKF